MLTDRQQQIINASIILIDRLGIQGFTIKNLSKEIGISEPAIYRHFESKVDILYAILDSFKQNISIYHQKKSELNNISGEERLKLFFSMIFDFFNKEPTLVSVIFAEEIFQNEPRLSQKVKEIQMINEKYIKSMIEQIQLSEKLSQTPTDVLALMFLGPVRLLVRKWKDNGYIFDLKRKGTVLVDTIFKSLKD